MGVDASWERVVGPSVGGVVALGLPNEQRVVVGTHSGVGAFDAVTGVRVLRVYDEDYRWWDAERGAILLPTDDGVEVVPAMGLWGGMLPSSTPDGWTWKQVTTGALLLHGQESLPVDDDEEFRGAGFSPEGSLFALATSPNLTILRRDAPGL